MADSEPTQPQQEEELPQQQSEDTAAQSAEQPPPQETAAPQQDEQGGGEGQGETQPQEEVPAEQQEGNEGGGEGGASETEEAAPEEEKVTITHEDNPKWLTPEQCLAKGVPEDQVTAFQHSSFQLAYSIRTWYDALSQHAFPTEFISLSTAEVDVLLAASHPGQTEKPDLTDEQKEILEQLEKKLNDSIEKFEGDGGFIRVNDRNPTDSILERNDAEFVARIRDAVINELEVFKQSANAYLIWRDTEKTEGAFRRGMTRLRQSFRRQRAPSTSSSSKKERPTQLEADKPEQAEEEEEKEGEVEKKEGEGEKEEGEVEKEDEGGEGEKKEGDEPAAAVTVEAQVEGEGEEKGEEQATPAEPTQQQEGGEGEAKPEEEEISPAEAAEEEPKTETEKPNELPPVCKVKSESLENEILRAFGCAITSMYRSANGKEAMDMLLRSGVIKQHLEHLKSFGEIEGVSATISVTRFHADIARYPGMVFRGFVYEGELNALSQKHDDVTYFPNVAQYKNVVQYKAKKFFDEQIKESLAEQGSYVIDLFVSTEKV
jgi:hypothetical protein